MNPKISAITNIHVEAHLQLTLEELCALCNVTPDFIHEVIAYGVLDETSYFNALHLRRLRMIQRLQQDLEVNLAGAALAIELMEEMEHMRAQLTWLEKHWETK